MSSHFPKPWVIFCFLKTTTPSFKGIIVLDIKNNLFLISVVSLYMLFFYSRAFNFLALIFVFQKLNCLLDVVG